jgi:hypothetical protein
MVVVMVMVVVVVMVVVLFLEVYGASISRFVAMLILENSLPL